jgi:hypothetical protein
MTAARQFADEVLIEIQGKGFLIQTDLVGIFRMLEDLFVFFEPRIDRAEVNIQQPSQLSFEVFNYCSFCLTFSYRKIVHFILPRFLRFCRVKILRGQVLWFEVVIRVIWLSPTERCLLSS